VALFSLYAIAYFLPISKAIIESFTILAIVSFIIKKILQRQGLPRTQLNYAIFIYIAVCLVSVFMSTNFKISITNFVNKLLENILFFFVLVETLNSQRRIKTFIHILFISSLLLGIDGIYQHFTNKDFIRHRPYYGLPRIHATFPTPNDFGCYLYCVIPFVLVSFFGLKYKFKKTARVLALALFILLFICLMLTVSRGAWFAFIAAVLFMSVWIRPMAIFLLILGILIATTQQFYGIFLRERMRSLFVFLDPGGLDRKMLWEGSWKMFSSSPLIGVGLGTFMFNFTRFICKNYFGVSYAHNCYLQMACEIGAIGLLSFLFVMASFFYYGIKYLNAKQKTFSWYILLASLASMLGYALQMMVDTNFYSLDLGLLFWIILGLGISAGRLIDLDAGHAARL
jgi:putative inorganic carbon (HCO3(-)) transporter